MFRLSTRNATFIHVLAAMTVVFLFSMAQTVYSHEFWVFPLTYQDGVLKSNIGYGHNFPKCEPISDDRIHIFTPLQVATPEGSVTLDQVGENYAYQKALPLKNGSYPVFGTYKSTFWSKGTTGWAQKDRLERPDAFYVQEAIMYAKSIVNVGAAPVNELATKPVGQRLEIVPMTNPTIAKPGDELVVKVLCDGNPVEGVTVTATYDLFEDKKHPAFEGKANKEGKVAIDSLKPGAWIVKARHAFKHPDQAKADEVVIVSTLFFQI